ncbi:MAG: hypothetical protein U0174_24675 [Polyangiaceae bacterium]
MFRLLSLHRALCTVPVALLVLATGCDDKTVKPDIASSAKATATAEPPPPPPKPTNTYLAVNEVSLSINGSPIPFAGPDAKTRMVLELTGKPNIAGDGASVEIARKSRAPDVAIVLAALKEAKATSVKVRTAKRDGVVTDLTFGYQDGAPGCSAAAFIGKDISISVWPISGQVAKRFAKGMAGPDLTMGGDAFRKAAAACDSPIAYVAADASITWGLVFDLALAAKEGGEGGAFRAQKFGVPVEEPVPGRKVTP